MKSLVTAILAAAALSVGVVACTEAPRRHAGKTEPAIMVTPATGRIQVGESKRLTAQTMNLVGAGNIRWNVSPNAGRIASDGNGQTALFTADQPGTYLITASADAGNGRIVSSDTTITVDGRPMTTDRDTSNRTNTTPPK